MATKDSKCISFIKNGVSRPRTLLMGGTPQNLIVAVVVKLALVTFLVSDEFQRGTVKRKIYLST